MATDTEDTERETDSRSSLRTLLLLAATFVAGYVLGARGGDGGGGPEWDSDEREPTEISIDESGTTSDESASGETEGDEAEANEE